MGLMGCSRLCCIRYRNLFNIYERRNFVISSVQLKVIPKNIKHFKKVLRNGLRDNLMILMLRAPNSIGIARSAFKLIEIDEKYNLLKPGQIVLECGAAPGAWTQVIVPKINSHVSLRDGLKDNHKPVGKVIAVDLLAFSRVAGAEILPYHDFRLGKTQHIIKEKLQGDKVDLILSDMAPNATGSKELDHDCIMELAQAVLEFSKLISKEGAHLLCKVWDGYRVENFLEDMRKNYESVKIVKPKSSRTDSSELFILGKNFKNVV